MLPVHVYREAARSIPAALSASGHMLAHACSSNVIASGLSIISGPAIVLGAHQVASRVLNLSACRAANVTVFRRSTGGTAFYLGSSGVICSIALPTVNALFADASAQNLLNRNVRAFLRAFRRLGIAAHYFGREWIAFGKLPGALLGLDTRASGVLLELFANFDASFSIPAAFASDEERALDRYLGKPPTSIWAATPSGQSHEAIETAQALLQGLSETLPTVVSLSADDFTVKPDEGLGSESNAVPPGFTMLEALRIPIGFLDLARSDEGEVWVGGDVLAGRETLSMFARGEPTQDVALFGVRGDELSEIVRRARFF